MRKEIFKAADGIPYLTHWGQYTPLQEKLLFNLHFLLVDEIHVNVYRNGNSTVYHDNGEHWGELPKFRYDWMFYFHGGFSLFVDEPIKDLLEFYKGIMQGKRAI